MFQKIKLRKLLRTKTQNAYLIVIQAFSVVMWDIYAHLHYETAGASDRVRELSIQSVHAVDFKDRPREEYSNRIEMLPATYLAQKINAQSF